MRVVYTLEAGTPLTEEQRAELRALKDRPIDFSDIPELPPDAFKNAVRGKFYRPVKQAVSLRLDADVIAWLKKDGDGYQTRVNQMLRERMLAALSKLSNASSQVEPLSLTEEDLCVTVRSRRCFPRLSNRRLVIEQANSWQLRRH